MNALSLDLRQRILKACDKHDTSRAQVAERFDVSLAMVKKLLSQRRRIGDIGSQRHRCGRKPLIDEGCRAKLRDLVEARPDATLQEMRSILGLDCTLVAIHYALIRMGLAYKKRLSMPVSKAAPMSPKRGGSGNAANRASTPRAWSSSTNRRPKRT